MKKILTGFINRLEIAKGSVRLDNNNFKILTKSPRESDHVDKENVQNNHNGKYSFTTNKIISSEEKWHDLEITMAKKNEPYSKINSTQSLSCVESRPQKVQF